MVSLHVSRLGKIVCMSRSPADTYDRLRQAGYLSSSALRKRTSVVALIEQTTDEFWRMVRQHTHQIGDELWRHIQRELVTHKYLSVWGRLCCFRYVSRGTT